MDTILSFSIPHINEYIFTFLNDAQLIHCRSISKTWKNAIDMFILRRWKNKLVFAFNDERISVVKLLLVNSLLDHSQLNGRDQYGFTLLIAACKNGNLEIVKLILKNYPADGIQVNLTDNTGKTALMWACRNGETDVARLLLQYSAIDCNVKDKDGVTAFMMACQFGHHWVVKLLLNGRRPHFIDMHDKSIDFNATDNYGNTALQMACFYDNVLAVQEILCCAHFEYIQLPAESSSFSGMVNQMIYTTGLSYWECYHLKSKNMHAICTAVQCVKHWSP